MRFNNFFTFYKIVKRKNNIYSVKKKKRKTQRKKKKKKISSVFDGVINCSFLTKDSFSKGVWFVEIKRLLLMT